MVESETGIQATLIKGGGGCFEVKLDGELIYSKHQTGQFPDQREIVRSIRQRDPGAIAG